jgi:hypothetical protein
MNKQAFKAAPLPSDIATRGIYSMKAVKIFFKHVIEVEGINFEPDISFIQYWNRVEEKQVYSVRQALVRDSLLSDCFALCIHHDIDIYMYAMIIYMHYHDYASHNVPYPGKIRNKKNLWQ